MSRSADLIIIGVCLFGIGTILLIEDRRAEENRAIAAAERRARELPAPPQEWPTPAPLPRASWSPEGFSYDAVDQAFDPCGSGPMTTVSSDETGVSP